MQGRISYFTWSCGWKLRVPLKVRVNLGDSSCLLREVRSPLALQGPPGDSQHITAGMNRASSGVRRELQGSSPFLTSITGSLQSRNRRVRPHLVLSKGTSLASGVVHGATGHLSNFIWSLQLFLDDATGVSVPRCVVTFSSGYIGRGLRHQDLS